MTPLPALQLIAAAWGALEIGLGLVKRSRASESRGRDRGSMILLFVTITGSLFLAQNVSFRQLAPILSTAGEAVLPGLALLVAGILLRWAAIVSLGRFFTMNVAVREGHRVVRHGLYRWVRHPSYTGLLVAFAGMGVALNDWLSVAVLLIPITAALLYRIRVEEKALLGSLGAEYGDYCAATARLIPFVF